MDDKSLYEQSFQRCMNLWEDNPALKELTFSQKLREVAASLLGATALRIWHDHGRSTKSLEDGKQTLIRTGLCGLWDRQDKLRLGSPFNGSTLASGAMGYSPGSTSLGLAKFSDITREIHEEPYPYFDHSEMADVVWVEAPVGSVVFHHSLTVHQAKPNSSDQVRRVYCVIYFEDGCVRSRPFPHQSLDRQGIQEGEPIQGRVTLLPGLVR